jgi:hypothetical protein
VTIRAQEFQVFSPIIEPITILMIDLQHESFAQPHISKKTAFSLTLVLTAGLE